MSSEATKPITTNRRHLIARRVIAPVSVACVGLSAPRSIRLASGSCRWQRNSSVRIPHHVVRRRDDQAVHCAEHDGLRHPRVLQQMEGAVPGFRVRQRKRHHVTGRRPPVCCRSPGLRVGAICAHGWRRFRCAGLIRLRPQVCARAPSSITPGLLAAEQDSSCKSVNGSDSATDGDLAVAYGLLLADRQWGSAGAYNYKNLAVARINAIKAARSIRRRTCRCWATGRRRATSTTTQRGPRTS